MFPRHNWISTLLNEWRDLNRNLKKKTKKPKPKQPNNKTPPTGCTASAFKQQPFKKCIFPYASAFQKRFLLSKKINESNFCCFILVL